MNIDQLIKMANRIGDFFSAMPNREEGLEGVANHIEKFWEPRMRKALLDFLANHPEGATADNALNETALAAVLKHRNRLEPNL